MSDINSSKDHANLVLESKTILRKFNRYYNRRPKNLKKEYIRIKVIRGHKRAIRQIQSNKKPRRTLHGFESGDGNAEAAWAKLVWAYRENCEVLDSVSRTETGPLTDGKTKRKPDEADTAKSFNNRFCAEYFRLEDVRKSFYYYVELLFVNKSPEALKQKFDICCCDSSDHTLECEIKWLSLKYFFNNLMLKELDLEPWFPALLPSNPLLPLKPLVKNKSQLRECLTQGTQTQ